MSNIHPTAIIAPEAKIHTSVRVGPYCIIGPNVILEKDVELMSHVVIDGFTSIGEGTKIFPFACIGTIPQDKKYHGESSRTIIGKNNIIREYVTIQPGTDGDKNETIVGDNCLLMVNSHVAHDCVLGDNVILANCATLAGHVHIGEFAVIGGLAAIHQFVRIGKHAIIGGMSGVVADVIPYGNVFGERASLEGLNIVGMKRRNFDKDIIHNLRKVYTMLFLEDHDTFEKRLESVQEEYQNINDIMEIVNFLRSGSSRNVCMPKNRKSI